MQNVILVVIGYIIAQSIAHSFFSSAFRALSTMDQEEFGKRTDRTGFVLRVIAGLSATMIIFGVLEAYGIIDFFPVRMSAGILIMFAGVILFCVEGILRYGVYLVQTQGVTSEPTPKRNMLLAFLIMLIGGVALGGIVGSMGWKQYQGSQGTATATNSNSRGGGSGGSTSGGATSGSSGETGSGAGTSTETGEPAEPAMPDYITQAKALEILERDEKYFELLVPYVPIRTKEENGETLYYYPDLEAVTFPPSMAELERSAARRENRAPVEDPAPDPDAEPLKE